jgi:hypothetical protein
MTLRRPALLVVGFRICSSFVPRAYKVVRMFIVCFSCGEEKHIDLWNCQNTETAYEYMKGLCFVLEPLRSIAGSVKKKNTHKR